jgi:hypothetical protein
MVMVSQILSANHQTGATPDVGPISLCTLTLIQKYANQSLKQRPTQANGHYPPLQTHAPIRMPM